MSYYDDNDVSTWGNISADDTDIEAMARLYVYDTVTKEIDMREDSGDEIPETLGQWSDVLGEELAWDNQQGEWMYMVDFDDFCDRVNVLLAYFLENYGPVKDIMIGE